jgi:hypothetical protein
MRFIRFSCSFSVLSPCMAKSPPCQVRSVGPGSLREAAHRRLDADQGLSRPRAAPPRCGARRGMRSAFGGMGRQELHAGIGKAQEKLNARKRDRTRRDRRWPCRWRRPPVPRCANRCARPPSPPVRAARRTSRALPPPASTISPKTRAPSAADSRCCGMWRAMWCPSRGRARRPAHPRTEGWRRARASG